MDRTAAFLLRLMAVRSVSGHAENAVSMVKEHFESLGISVWITRKGSLWATLRGKTESAAVLAAHLDTLGAMVSSIRPDGTLRYRTVGGLTPGSVEGEYCQVETFDGRLISGTILFDSTSVHAYGHEKAAAKREHSDMYVRVDHPVENPDDARKLGISVGNYVHFDPRPVLTESGYIKGRHLDDKAGAAVLAAAAENLAGNGKGLRRTVHFLFTTHEEVGHGGAGWYPPGVEDLVAVDMGVLGKDQTGSETRVSICMADSGGPYNYDLSRRLAALAEEHGIPYAVDTYPFYGSDTGAALRMGLDVRHGLIGPGVDASHAMERTHVKGIKAAADLAALFAAD